MEHTILCVDDEADTVDSLGRLFRKKYKILKATSGKQALDLLKENSDISVILSDQRMPEMSGVEFLEKSLDFVPDAMRILLTGYTDIDSVIGAINSGQIYRYINKPWDPVDLMATVDQAIEKIELRLELKEKNKKLKSALDELQTLDQSKTHFMILINHELKTPLTSMLSFLQLLNESPLTDEQQLYVKRIIQSTDRLQNLIDRVLLLIKAETGVLEIKKQDIAIADLVTSVGLEIQDEANKKQIKITTTGAATAISDPLIAKTVLENLMGNAIKFAKADSTVLISIKADGKISISNEGPEIPQDKIDTLLKPFTLDEDIMNHSKGLGLGLSLVQALLHRLGTQLHLQSTEGKTQASIQFI